MKKTLKENDDVSFTKATGRPDFYVCIYRLIY